MIRGSVSFKGVIPTSFSRKVQSIGTGSTYCPVSYDCFDGGYYLHHRLPYVREDIYYDSDRDGILILFSGAIYNLPELSEAMDILAPVHIPELIAALFLREGPGFVEKLNGDFVIFILRPSIKEAYLFRDHLGIRPMSWTADDGTLSFSSDAIDLCRHFHGKTQIDCESLLGYFKYIDYRRTPCRHVRKLPPGTYLKYTSSAIEIKRYWTPEKIRINKSLSYEDMLAEVKEMVSSAIEVRCDKRFTAGAHYSGGLDSGIVATLARKEYGWQQNFHGFSWSPSADLKTDATRDERKAIIKSCRETGIIPVFSDLDKKSFPAFVADFLHNRGYFLESRTAKQAEEYGLNLIFSGWGGDEFISSGHSGIDLDLLRRMKFSLFLRRSPVGNPRKFIRHFLFFVVFPALHILDPLSARSFKEDSRYIRKQFRKSDRKAIANFYFHCSRREMHLNVLKFYNLPERCESWHLLSFHRGVEYRYPLLDKRIIEYILTVPSELLAVTGQFRPLLREIGKGVVPDEIRLNQDKNDPVLWEYLDELYKSAALSFMEEAGSWEVNPDLHFVDFRLLRSDIVKYREGSPVYNERVLFRTLVYLKALHEFTVSYRQNRQA